MPELALLPDSNSNQVSLGSTPRESSPDSVIYGAGRGFDSSNISLFSSAPASADRSSSSFASDFHDRDPHRQKWVAHEEVSNGGVPDPERNKLRKLRKNFVQTGMKGDTRTEGVPLDSRAVSEDDGPLTVESARNSFSLALKDCQKRRSDLLPKMSDFQCQASADLNYNGTAYSPRLGAVKTGTIASRRSAAFPSPGTPNYRLPSGGLQKGWNSERVPLPQNGNRRQVSGSHFSFNNGRATLPSKWEDAERWIFSPVATDAGFQPSVPQPQVKPKSKSGPLGPSGVGYYSSYSPAVPMFEGGNGGNVVASSPFATSILAAEKLRLGYGYNMGCSNTERITRSVSIHGGAAELLNQFSLPQSPRIDEEYDDGRDAATDISRAVSRRDMATQMSPEGSPCSSPIRRHSSSSAVSIVEMRTSYSPRDVRDVEVDEKVTMTKWSKKTKSRLGGRGPENIDDWARKAVEAHSTAWEGSDAAKSLSKVRREEARIAAWENLQKAKAEAKIRKLEMKLEKKRSSSMDKIMNKLRLAQKKGHDMRRAVLAHQAQQVSEPPNKAVSLRSPRSLSSLSGCFTCHAF